MSSDQQEYGMPVPGAEHEKLAPFVGTFRAAVKLWMGPGDPIESTGTIENKLQIGGLYLHQDYVGDQTEGPFPSFVGQGYWGYNTTAKQYEGFWIDNASTMMQLERGDLGADGKTWTMHSEMRCPQSGQKLRKRSVIELVDDDHHRMVMFFTGEDGQEMKGMEIVYTRA